MSIKLVSSDWSYSVLQITFFWFFFVGIYSIHSSPSDSRYNFLIFFGVLKFIVVVTVSNRLVSKLLPSKFKWLVK